MKIFMVRVYFRYLNFVRKRKEIDYFFGIRYFFNIFIVIMYTFFFNFLNFLSICFILKGIFVLIRLFLWLLFEVDELR